MNSKVIFDLDDTLINTRKRHYHVVKLFFNSKFNDEFFDFETYSNFRISGKSNYEIISSVFNVNYLEFKKFWLLNIEESSSLFFDKNIVLLKLLKEIKKKFEFDFYVVSLRSNKVNALNQVRRMNFYNEFKEFIFLSHSDLNPKVQILKELNKKREIEFFIGDSYTDYEAAKQNEIKFIHVQTGWERKHDVYVESFKDINCALKNIFNE